MFLWCFLCPFCSHHVQLFLDTCTSLIVLSRNGSRTPTRTASGNLASFGCPRTCRYPFPLNAKMLEAASSTRSKDVLILF